MAFTDIQIETAFKTAKQFTVEELVSIIVELPPMEEPKKEKAENKEDDGSEVTTWKSYSCTSCTFLNEEDPGPKCCMCEAAAPAEAWVVKISEKKQKENAKKAKEEEETRKAAEREARRLQEEQEREVKLAAQVQECKDYFEKSEVNTFLAASVCGGKSVRPVIFACAL